MRGAYQRRLDVRGYGKDKTPDGLADDVHGYGVSPLYV